MEPLRQQANKEGKSLRITRRERDLQDAKLPTFLAPYIKVNLKSISLIVSDREQFVTLWTLLAQQYAAYVDKDGHLIDNSTANTSEAVH